MMGTLEVIVQEADKVKIALPNVTALREALKTAKEWSTKVDKVQVVTILTNNPTCLIKGYNNLEGPRFEHHRLKENTQQK